MQFTISAASLRNALSLVIKASDQRGYTPVLSHALLDARGDIVTVSATDMEAFVSVTSAAIVVSKGKAVLPIKPLLDFIKGAAKGAEIKISVGDDGATVQCGGASANLATLLVDDYPTLKSPPSATSISIPAVEFVRLLSLVRHAISTEETRYYLNGINLEVRPDDGVLRAVATDGHRLAWSEMPLPSESDVWSGIVPSAAVSLIVDAIGKKPAGNVHLHMADRRFAVTYGVKLVVTKLVDGTFPDYQRVVPRGNSNVLTTSAVEFAATATSVASISSERSRPVKLSLSDDVTISARFEDRASSSKLNGITSYAGDPMEIGFQARYLHEMLKEIGAVTIDVAFSDSCAPAVITSAAVPGFTGVIMPIRI